MLHSPLSDCEGKGFILAGTELVQEKTEEALDNVSEQDLKQWRRMNHRIAEVLGLGTKPEADWPWPDQEEEMFWDNNMQSLSFKTAIAEPDDLLNTGGFDLEGEEDCHFL